VCVERDRDRDRDRDGKGCLQTMLHVYVSREIRCVCVSRDRDWKGYLILLSGNISFYIYLYLSPHTQELVSEQTKTLLHVYVSREREKERGSSRHLFVETSGCVWKDRERERFVQTPVSSCVWRERERERGAFRQLYMCVFEERETERGFQTIVCLWK